MAQLVKLNDYVSRYEADIYRYPSRFVRLKKERWEKLLSDWSNKTGPKELEESLIDDSNYLQMTDEKKQDDFIGKLKQWFPSRKKEEKSIEKSILDISAEDRIAHSKLARIKSKEQLKDAFKDEIFQFQLNWASSTISEKSHIKRKYHYDPVLSYLLKELPDSFFVFYQPVVYLKKAPVDFDVIILTPSEIWLVVVLLGSENTIYQHHSDKYWIKSHREGQEKFLHPNIKMKRMRSVIEHILLDNEVSFPIKTAILAKDSYIDIPKYSQRVKYYDRRNYIDWHRLMVKNVSPIKHNQLKIAETLLSQTLTLSTARHENVEEESNSFE